MTKSCTNPTKKYIKNIYLPNIFSHFIVTGFSLLYLILLVNHNQNNVLSCKTSTLNIMLRAFVGSQIMYTLLSIIPTLHFLNTPSNSDCSVNLVSKCHKNYANSTLTLNSLSHLGVTGSIIYATIYLPYIYKNKNQQVITNNLENTDTKNITDEKIKNELINNFNSKELNKIEEIKKRNILIGIFFQIIYVIMSRVVRNTFNNCINNNNSPL